MEVGVGIALDPAGGNQVNFREVLRGVVEGARAEVEAEDDEEEEGDEDVEVRGRGGEFEYDLDDDFIDDGDVGSGSSEGESDEREGEDAVAVKAWGRAGGTGKVVEHVFGRFYVNRGDILTRVVEAPTPAEPPAVAPKDKQIVFAEPKVPVTITGAESNAIKAVKTVKKFGSLKDVGTAKEVGIPKDSMDAKEGKDGKLGKTVKEGKSMKDSKDGKSSALKKGPLKEIPAPVLAEIDKLAALCTQMFPGKKPKLQDGAVQDQLHTLFESAMAAGVGRLHSDIAKDNRRVALNDEIWTLLGAFLRTKRSYLENLGHALHFSAEEQAARRRVDAAEQALTTMVQGREGPFMWDTALYDELHSWYRARCDLQMAKNQLSARSRSLKKALLAWTPALCKSAFANKGLTDADLAAAVRRVGVWRAAEEKERRDAEKERRDAEKERRDAEKAEKKREREAAAASKAAAAAAPFSAVSATAAKAVAALAAATKRSQAGISTGAGPNQAQPVRGAPSTELQPAAGVSTPPRPAEVSSAQVPPKPDGDIASKKRPAGAAAMAPGPKKTARSKPVFRHPSPQPGAPGYEVIELD